MFEKFFIEERLDSIDQDFLQYEIERLDTESQNIIAILAEKQLKKPIFLENPNNSILLYVLGLTDEFDFKLARSYMIGGAAPDLK